VCAGPLSDKTVRSYIVKLVDFLNEPNSPLHEDRLTIDTVENCDLLRGKVPLSPFAITVLWPFVGRTAQSPDHHLSRSA
jgi:hypothetical protein